MVPFHICPDHFFATVLGTTAYLVGLDYLTEDRDLGVSCTCPYYKSTGMCKHLWAAMRLADTEGGLTNANHVYATVTMMEPEGMEEIIAEYVLDTESLNDISQLKDIVPRKQLGKKKTTFKSKPEWESKLGAIQSMAELSLPKSELNTSLRSREVFYIINLPDSLHERKVVIDIGFQERLKSGKWSKLKVQRIQTNELDRLPDSRDRQILSLLQAGTNETGSNWRYYSYYGTTENQYTLDTTVVPFLLPLMSATGRLRYTIIGDPKVSEAATYHSGREWTPVLKIEPERTKSGNPSKSNLIAYLELVCGDERRRLDDRLLVLPAGLIIAEEQIEQLSDPRFAPLVQSFIVEGTLKVPAKSLDAFLEECAKLPFIPSIETPDGALLTAVPLEPQPTLVIHSNTGKQTQGSRLTGTLGFNYNDVAIVPSEQRQTLLRAKDRQLVYRDTTQENACIEELRAAGFVLPSGYVSTMDEWVIDPKKFAKAIRQLSEQGWLVEANGKLYRTTASLNIQVSSGIDWFDLEGSARFDDASISFPELLKSINKGQSTILLDDGSLGLIPEEWIKRYSNLAKSVKADGGAIRFNSNQVILLDMLLAELPEAQFDKTFHAARERLQSFEGVSPMEPPTSFHGELRPYQKVGLGWFQFLRNFGFGGCLADDMGLGKTVQALALLEDRRLQRYEGAESAPGDQPQSASLAVVPKSLIFNWIEEAKRFSPNLKILDYTGIGRKQFKDHLDEFDVILTTYGTLRRDILHLREKKFDYIILDESQAIKNEKSATAKAARLLQGTHRLAMSGTPIENRIEELWSLFEFLNPGMLGTATLFNSLATATDSDEAKSALSRSIRPFILRRTKENVAKDLPEKVEQTLYVELDKTQRKLYNDLRDHFRADVLSQVDSVGMNRSKIKVLEALLRLRQAACHPGLIDKKKAKLACGKFEMLLPQLEEIAQEGHKALVFSQFTSFLGLLRTHLDANGTRYVYLDGKTRDRQAKVDEFQNDPDCSLFLISLKAGGVGLNLTEAEYVFLLDPWWNPAVEAQAIDRTHRIGQKNNVFAYRLIAKDTVEEKVLELQEKKRALAESIITGDNALIRNLAREDLEMLLS